jgi:hypothetical protein
VIVCSGLEGASGVVVLSTRSGRAVQGISVQALQDPAERGLARHHAAPVTRARPRWSRQKVARVAPAALAIAVPLAYAPNLLGGLGGQVKASEILSSWFFASRHRRGASAIRRPNLTHRMQEV